MNEKRARTTIFRLASVLSLPLAVVLGLQGCGNSDTSTPAGGGGGSQQQPAAAPDARTQAFDAINQNKPDVVLSMVDKNEVPLEAVDRNKDSLLQMAIFHKEWDLAKKLLAKGADGGHRDWQNDTPLNMCAWFGAPDDLSELVLAHQGDLKNKVKGGYTPLLSAAGGNQTGTLTFFINKKNDVNAQTDDGRTALMMAAGQGNLASVKVLLAHHANVKLRDKTGKTALDYAGKNAEVAKAIKAAGGAKGK